MTDKTLKTAVRGVLAAGSVATALMMTGCAGLSTSSTGPVALTGPALRGSLHGGRQPIAGATLHLYAASTAGYAAGTTDLLPAGTVTDANGNFNITSQYTCTAGQQMYLVSLGGVTSPGAAANPQAALMAGLGDCYTLQHNTPFININEVTTVATAFALSPFMTGYANLGSTTGGAPGLTRAMVNVNKLANIGTGFAGGPALANGATAPTALVDSVADVLASCINSTGGTAAGTTCGDIFNYATPATGAPTPTDTIGLALTMAKFPTQNVSTIFNTYVTPVTPYQPLSSAPTDWTMSVVYPGFSGPTSTTIDASNQVWVANSTFGNSVSVLAQTGNVNARLFGNGLSTPVAVAIDASGNGFVANKGSNTVSAFTNAGAVFGSSPFTVGTAPTSLAFDGSGNLFVANSGSNNVSELSGTGAPLATLTTGVTAPSAVAIDPK